LAFTFGAFFGENVSTVALAAFEGTASVAFKTFRRATIGFYFWHMKLELLRIFLGISKK
jgi:hypothetical protein